MNRLLFTAAIVTSLLLPAAAAQPVLPVAAMQIGWHSERHSGDASGKRCVLTSPGGDVAVRFFQDSLSAALQWTVRVGFDNPPGSLRYLRINRAYYTTDQPSFLGAEAAAIVRRLKMPGEFAFEWAQQPDYRKRQGLFGIGDFAIKAAACERWLAGTPV